MGKTTALPSVGLVLSLLCASGGEIARADSAPPNAAIGPAAVAMAGDRRAVHLTAGDSIGDLLDHPAFAGFGRLILPWDDRAPDPGMRLSQMASLLPYHTNVDPQTIVQSLNGMIDDAAAGQRVFHDIYTEAEKQAEPGKRNTGLFFYRGRPGAPFAIISPGGGFAYVGSVHEGFPYARQISARGYNAFVLRYRAGQGGRIPTEDLAAAIGFVFKNAEALGVGRRGYSLWGSSAGARMAAAIGSHGVAAFGGGTLPRPSTVVMAYTAHSDHVADELPTFVVVGGRDGIAPAATMAQRVAALRRAGTKVEFHEYPDLGHGFGPGTGTAAAGWIADAIRFWQEAIGNGRD